MKTLFLTLLFLFSFNCLADEDTEPEVSWPKLQKGRHSTLKLKDCDTHIDCSFKGQQRLAVRYIYATDEINYCDHKIPCMYLELFPRDRRIFPHFENYPIRSITVINSEEIAMQLLGRRVWRKIRRSGTLYAKGSANVILTNFSMGIACDAPYASAKVIAVLQHSPGKLLPGDTGGC